MSETTRPFVMSPKARAAALALAALGANPEPTQPVQRIGVGYDRPRHDRLKKRRKRERQNKRGAKR